MSAQSLVGQDSRRIGELQKAQQQEEFRRALRALLMRPLMPSVHEDFPAVRRQAARLIDWFAREAGWPLHIEREGARLLKRPADLADETRGLPEYDRRRYVLLCLACANMAKSLPAARSRGCVIAVPTGRSWQRSSLRNRARSMPRDSV